MTSSYLKPFHHKLPSNLALAWAMGTFRIHLRQWWTGRRWGFCSNWTCQSCFAGLLASAFTGSREIPGPETKSGFLALREITYYHFGATVSISNVEDWAGLNLQLVHFTVLLTFSYSSWNCCRGRDPTINHIYNFVSYDFKKYLFILFYVFVLEYLCVYHVYVGVRGGQKRA